MRSTESDAHPNRRAHLGRLTSDRAPVFEVAITIADRRASVKAKEEVTVNEIPEDVVSWVRDIFAECNRRITDRLDRNPNAPEESFDLTWIEQVGGHAAPTIFQSNWTAKVEAHYLGGLRHFNRWEIADIGVLVFLRLGPGMRTNKVALRQSKRLYPINRPVREETRSDYEVGFARLADPEDAAQSIGQEAEFSFTRSSKYGALRAGSDQARAIDKYQEDNRLTVYYQFDNPWRIPTTQRIPLAGYVSPNGVPELGVRIIPAGMVHSLLAVGSSSSPCLEDLEALPGLDPYGWRLEDFVSSELLGCREGDQFETLTDERIQGLFFRRTGAIAAAIAITIEAPDALPAA